MKLTSIVGTGTGKLGGSVFRVVNGKQIVAAYQPVVNNPSTDLQVTQRAKFKILSQLASVFRDFGSFRRPARVGNMIVSKNMSKVTYSNGQANIPMLNVELTDGVLALPAITATKTGAVISVGVSRDISQEYDAVAYIIIDVVDGRAVATEPKIVTTAGTDGHFSTTYTISTVTEGYAYAYGIKYADENVRVRYTNIGVVSPNALLSAIRSASISDAQVSVSRAVAITTQQ